MKRTGTTNNNLKAFLIDLNRSKSKFWKRVKYELERPTRKRRHVNVAKLEKYAKDQEIIVVPGKLLGKGILTKKLKVASLSASKQAVEKVTKNNGQVIDLKQLYKENPTGSKTRIIV